MSLTTIMYHFVFEMPQAEFPGLPFLPKDELLDQIEFLLSNGMILRKGEDIEEFLSPQSEKRFLLSFDDSLRCHKDIVLPILDEAGIQAAFSIYVEPVEKRTVSLLERQRYLQYNIWPYAEFLERFLSVATSFIDDGGRANLLSGNPEALINSSEYLAEEKYYSAEERYFRYCRDMVLSETEFEQIIEKIFLKNCDEAKIAAALYMTKEDVRLLSEHGHIILGHSFSHPIRMDLLPRAEMAQEVRASLDALEGWIGERPTGFAYPCGRVNKLLFEVVAQEGVKYAFVGGDPSNFDVPGPGELKLLRMDAVEFWEKVAADDARHVAKWAT